MSNELFIAGSLEEIIEANPEKTFLSADGLEGAVIGYKGERLVYSVAKCIEILMEDMSREDALEYFDFNTRDAYVGEQTPIWMEDL